jgi:large subunit ribosomal protein L14e
MHRLTVPRDLPELGRVVQMLKGRQHGEYAVVVGHENGRYVLLADGDSRSIDRPKRKNLMHVRRTEVLAHVVVEAIQAEGKITNARLRYAMRLFHEGQESNSRDSLEDGSGLNGEG